jgi:hypothetical protein
MAAPGEFTLAEAKRIPALDALRTAIGGTGEIPIGRSAAFTCPFPDCGVLAQHHWGVVSQLAWHPSSNSTSSRSYGGATLVTSICEACLKEVLFLNGQMIWPMETDAPPPATDLPNALTADFEEARAIYRASPRGAAALLRLLIQKLCLELGSSEKDINKAIGGFVKDGRISPVIQKALDAVRVVGNESVHPGTMDLKDDTETVNSLFGIINFIVEKMITEPKEIDAIYSALPAGKLAGIAKRDANG